MKSNKMKNINSFPLIVSELSKQDTVHFNIRDVAASFVTLHYSCGILSEGPSAVYKGFTCLMADGIPFLTFKKVHVEKIEFSPLYFIANIAGYNVKTESYSLDKIKKQFIRILSGKKPLNVIPRELSDISLKNKTNKK